MVAVAATWTGAYAVSSGFFFPYPAARPVQIPVTNTAGDWLFALVAWRQPAAGSGASVCVADDAHNWWEPVGAPSADSGAAGTVRTAVWAAPAARVANSVTGVTQVQVAATGPVLGLAVTIVDVSGLLPWYQVAAITGGFTNAGTSLSLSAGAPSASALEFAVFASDNNSDTITGPAGWTALTTVSASNGVDHTADIKVTPAWQVTSSASSASVSSSGSLDLAGIIAGVLVSAAQPPQPSLAWPVMITEAAIGAGVQTPPSQLTWTDISARSLSLSMKQGKQYSQGSLSAGQGTITLDNPDGALIPPGTGPFTGIDSGTPLRRRVIWPGLRTTPQAIQDTTGAYILDTLGQEIFDTGSGTPNVTPHYVAFNGYFRRWPWQMDAGMLRGKTQAEIADVWAYGAGPLNSMAIQECQIDQPYALWPATDPAGSSAASNVASGNSLPLNQVQSKYGNGGATAVFGVSAAGLVGTSSAQVTTSGTGGGSAGMWQQTLAGNSLAYQGFGYALTCTDPNFPSITNGVTLEVYAGCTLNSTLTAISGNGLCLVSGAGALFNTAQSKFPNGMPITLGGGSLPGGFSPGTYYVRDSDGQGNYNLSATQGGTAISPTSGGTGTVAPFILWSPVFCQLADGKGIVAGLSIRASDGALLLPYRGNFAVVDSGHDYRAGIWHLSLAMTQTSWRVMVNGGGQALTASTGTFSPSLPATFREATFAGTQDSVQHGNSLPGTVSFAAVYPGFSAPIRVLSHYYTIGVGMAGEASCDRVERILEYAGLAGRRWIGQQVIPYEGDLCASGKDIGGQPAASSAGNIAASTLPAQLYVAPTGDITYLSKYYTWNQPVRWTLGDKTGSGEIPFLPGQVATDYDPTRVSSPVQVTSLDTQYVTVPSGATASTTMGAVTAAAGRQYGGQPYQSTSYLDYDFSSQYTAGGSSVDLANWVANIYRKPQNRIQAVTVDAAGYPAGWPFWAGASVGDMVQVNVRPPTGAYTISLIARITQTDRNSQFSQDGASAAITCTLDFAPEYNCLTCDDAVRGLLNGQNVLGWLPLRRRRSPCNCTCSPLCTSIPGRGLRRSTEPYATTARSRRKGPACAAGRSGIPLVPTRCACRIQTCSDGRRIVTTSQITLPAPRTWAVNDYVLIPRLRADVSDAVALLTQKPLFLGQCTTGANVSGGGGVFPLDTELTDNWGGHLEDVSPAFAGVTAAYWCPLPGWYLCDVRTPFNYTSTTPAAFAAGTNGISNNASYGPFYGAVQVNGVGQGIISRAVDLVPQYLSGPPNNSTGDLIQPWGYAGPSGTIPLSTSAASLPNMAVRWALAITGTAPLAVPPLGAVPTPITSAWLNANVRDTVRFLLYPPALKAHYTPGSSTLANSTLTTPQVVPLTTADLDNYSGLTTGASAKYTIPRAGRYLVAGQVNLAASSTTTFYACGVLVNSTTLYWGGIVRFAGTSLAGGAGITRRLRFNANDTVQLVAAQGSGGAIAYHTTAANQTRLIMLWEGL